MAVANLTVARLRELISYDPETGGFVWRMTCGPRAVAGTSTGTTNKKGYRVIKIEGAVYFCHTLAWMWGTGKRPQHGIDHIDGDKANNRWSNLRDVNQRMNLENQVRPHRRSKSGTLGVIRSNTPNERWFAQITVRGKQMYLGTYATREEAGAVYIEAKRRLHGGCSI